MMLCREIMKDDVKWVTTQSTVTEVAVLMRDEEIGFVPICDASRNVVGILTDRDIAIRVVAAGEHAEQPAAQFMTVDIVACRSDDDVGVAQDLMSDLQVSRVICLNDEGQVEGVISLSDIAQVGDSDDVSATLSDVSARETRQ
jgi:CBS domain-containing protein